MEKRYVLFDWDNTVREGFTLFSWIDYLCDHAVIDIGLQKEMDVFKAQYGRHLITHDQYAEFACATYAAALAGRPLDRLTGAVTEYMTHDRKCLFRNLGVLFDLLHEKGADIIVISGAPVRILDQYREDFNLKSIYAFREKVSQGLFTGEVEYNYGFNKKETVFKLIEAYHSHPYMAFGDSESDVPMLKNATHAFSVNHDIEGAQRVNIGPEGIGVELLRRIEAL